MKKVTTACALAMMTTSMAAGQNCSSSDTLGCCASGVSDNGVTCPFVERRAVIGSGSAECDMKAPWCVSRKVIAVTGGGCNQPLRRKVT